MTLPTVFVTHGGGPLPLLGDPGHAQLAAALRSLPARLSLPAAPTAVLLCSAHFEAPQPTLIATPPSKLLYDYGGFPPESYQLQYAPPGAPRVADEAMRLLRSAGFSPRLEASGRGLDHGAFVPLMLMWPHGDVPVVELSVLSSLAPEDHTRMGEALRPLRDRGVLIVGSGSSWHNVPKMFEAMSGRLQGAAGAQAWDDYLVGACTQATGRERSARLAAWAGAPGAADAHPRAEHLMPLLVAAAAAGDAAGAAERVAMGPLPLSNFVFGAGSGSSAAA